MFPNEMPDALKAADVPENEILQVTCIGQELKEFRGTGEIKRVPYVLVIINGNDARVNLSKRYIKEVDELSHNRKAIEMIQNNEIGIIFKRRAFKAKDGKEAVTLLAEWKVLK